MAENKSKTRLRNISSVWLARFFNRFLVLKTWVSLTLFTIAFAFFTFLLRLGGDLGRLTIVVYGIIMLFLCFFLIAEYVLKTINLQRDSGIRIYSSILTVNTVFGLIFPLIYGNIILAVIMRSLRMMTYYGTFWCQTRISVVNLYYNLNIYTEVNTIIFWVVIFSVILFLFGGLLEKLNSKN